MVLVHNENIEYFHQVRKGITRHYRTRKRTLKVWPFELRTRTPRTVRTPTEGGPWPGWGPFRTVTHRIDEV